jgi:toxin ParE1/3/4
MDTKRLEIHPSAVAEIKAAIEWYLERSEIAAVNFTAELDRAVDLIIGAPGRWPTGEHGTRKFVLTRFPFAIVFREKQTVIQIIAVAHGHRNPKYWKERL